MNMEFYLHLLTGLHEPKKNQRKNPNIDKNKRKEKLVKNILMIIQPIHTLTDYYFFLLLKISSLIKDTQQMPMARILRKSRENQQTHTKKNNHSKPNNKIRNSVEDKQSR